VKDKRHVEKEVRCHAKLVSYMESKARRKGVEKSAPHTPHKDKFKVWSQYRLEARMLALPYSMRQK
jgi:hypothetical protein